MLQSMTGFGRSEFTLGAFTCSLEIRSLNGKQFELNAKIPSLLKAYETNLRSILQQYLTRGSIDLTIFIKQHGSSKPVSINMELARYYHDAMQQIAQELQLPMHDMLPTLMRMPEIVATANETIEEDDWKILASNVEQVCAQLVAHRKEEGTMLSNHIRKNIETIQSLCESVHPMEENRVKRIRERLHTSMQDLIQQNNLDNNRMEQEIIYYIEKLDITEEKNRLLHHCDYFFQLLADDEQTKGKKLGFLLQEIGREINTMGSKANDVHIQKVVVSMKDELEQAKEQLLNAL
jgi:uncharacterized protein (TIGR00255 family)